MSKPPSNPPSSGKSTKSSGRYQLVLDETLSSPEGRRAVKRGRDELEHSKTSVPPDSEAPDSDKATRESMASSSDVEDLKESTGAFVAGVDQITDVLLLILGKFDKALFRIQAVTVLSVLAFLGIMYVSFRVQVLSYQQDADQKELEALRNRLEKKIDRVEKGQKEAADKTPTIRIVGDEDGNAKVVIEPSESAKAAAPPPPSTTARYTAPAPKATRVEIPLDLPNAKKVPPDAKEADVYAY